MNSGERVDVIRGLVDRLTQEEWPMADMILKQFGFPTSEWYSGDLRQYMLEMVQASDDANLTELAGYFGLTKKRSAPTNTPDFWEPEFYRLFVSHCSEDKVAVTALSSELKNCGFSTFVAHVDISPTREWQEQIELALRTCDGLLAYLVPSFHQSKWTDQEVGFALARGSRVIPLDRGSLPYGFMGKYQALRPVQEATDSEVALEVLKTVAGDSREGPSMANLIIRRLALSSNYGTSSRCVDALAILPVITPAEFAQLKQAYEANDQFRKVFGMTNRLKRLHSKFN